MQSIKNIVFMLVGLVVFLWLLNTFLGVNTQEGFTFCNPGDCDCVCERNEYKNYCTSPYLKDGPAGLCKCEWDSASRVCRGSRSGNTKCMP